MNRPENDVLIFKKRQYVRRVTSAAIANGTLVPGYFCELCDDDANKLEAHHIDYGKPLDVRWLCKRCHGLVHRKDHSWNPENNEQTPMPYIHDLVKSMVTVSCAIPAINFLAIDEIAKNTGRSISDLIKEKVIQEFPVESNQLKFNFEEIDDNSQQITESRIQKLATDETNVPESTICRVQKIRRPRNINLSNVDKILCKFSARHGADTG